MLNVTRNAIAIGKENGKESCFKLLLGCQRNLDYLAVPYPSAQKLSELLTDSDVLSVLPKTLLENPDSKVDFSVVKTFNLPELNINAELVLFVDTLSDSEITGWAYIPELESTVSYISILLKKDSTCYKIRPMPVSRPDVSAHFNAGDLYNDSGFKCNFKDFDIPKGKYQIGIFITNGGKKALSWIDGYYTNE